jgi:hypothetical protein
MTSTWKSTVPLWVMAAVLAALFLWDRRHRAAETEQLHAQIRALEEAARRDDRAASEAARRPVFVMQGVRAAPADPPAPEATQSAAPARARALRAEELEARFRSEPRAGGASRDEGVLQRAVSAFREDASSVASIECRASLCRMELVHPDIPTSNALIEKLFLGPTAALHGASFVSEKPETTPDGQKRIVLLVPSDALSRLD